VAAVEACGGFSQRIGMLLGTAAHAVNVAITVLMAVAIL
jgi:hypothetical protein